MSPAIEALQRALAAEHAAVWGYGVVGGHLLPAQQRAAADAERAHRAWRDALSLGLRDRGATPVAAAASYELPFAVTDAATARRLAVHLEEGTAAVWHAALSAVSTPADRRLALAALTAAATRAVQWRLTVPGMAPTVPFPGA